MIELTEQQSKQLSSAERMVVDPKTQELYVLVPKKLYERIPEGLKDDEWGSDELRVLLARSATANDWDAPGMDAYDRYDEERQRQCR